MEQEMMKAAVLVGPKQIEIKQYLYRRWSRE